MKETEAIKIEDIKAYGIYRVMNRHGWQTVEATALRWNASPAAVRAMIQRGQIRDDA